MFDFLSSIFGGGLTGILGIGVQRFFDHQNKKLDLQISREKMAHEVAMRRADAEIMAQEWAARTKVAEVEGAARVESADAAAFAASFNEPQRYSQDVKPNAGQGWALVFLDLVRGLVRPVMTTYLIVIVSLVYWQCRNMLLQYGVNIQPEEAIGLMDKVIDCLLYLATTACLWWFGTRSRGKTPSLR